MLVVFFVGFVAGIFAILGLELVVVLVVVTLLNRRIQRKIKRETDAAAARKSQAQHSLDSICPNMQGVVWVLDSEKIASKEQKRKRDVIIEVSPVRKHAQIQDQYLTLTSSDSSCIFIPLKGCIIQAVSATNMPSRKWAKRYPIKVETKSSLYNGSKIIYLYLETAWEKESWCKCLRLASWEDYEKINWFIKLKMDFQAYRALLSSGYSSFMKPSLGYSSEPMDKGSKSDGSISKVKSFWKRLSKKNSKPGERKGNSSNQSVHEERKACEKQHPFQESGSNKALNSSTEENMAFTPPQGFPRSESQSGASVASDAESEHEKPNNDEGILCWNLLISRVFFDIKVNEALKSSLQARIQRTLSSMRTPNYIGEVICTNIDIGHLPPYIHAMRLLGNDMNDVSSFEVDAEYSGGALIDVETRIEVRDQDFQKGIEDTDSESNSVENMSSDLLEGFEHFGKHLSINKEDIVDPKIDCGKGSRATSGSGLKSVLNNIAKQVSQVPLTLSVRVVALRGTLRLYIKPPPSDQLWFGFTSMPDVEFVLESSVGDHKITNGHIALFLMNRFKAAIRETMVLPNCESAYIPWMIAEKDDWIPRNVAPYIWLQEGCSDKREAPVPQVTDSKAYENGGSASNSDIESKDSIPATARNSTARLSINSMTILSSCPSYRSLHDLATPRRTTIDDVHDRRHRNLVGASSLPSLYSRSMREFGRHTEGSDSDWGPKPVRRTKLRDFKKRMGEKFGEKKRHMEEKGRNIVDKMKSKDKDKDKDKET
ncbi:hypothetical protein like AT1G17820 [Hibiscus trionum]|uniref:SMP-LTD domain-containing protein n=1 Tax=Hibiscus trionum TaxID=183268 RepID=A0A9W7H852_HIBTR|nr:hypothetical protein like AT1G17820 [Hibiscus trionum]